MKKNQLRLLTNILCLVIGLSGSCWAGHGEDLSKDLSTVGGAMELLTPSKPLAKKQVKFELVFTKSNKQFTGFQKVHKRYLHVMIIHKNFNHFGHIHPSDFIDEAAMEECLEKGRFPLEFNFPEAGKYLIIADIKTKDGFFHSHKIIEVEGVAAPTPSYTDFSGKQGLQTYKLEMREKNTIAMSFIHPQKRKVLPFQVEMKHNNHLCTDQNNVIQLSFSKSGMPLRALQNYLDAPLHVLIVKEDLSRFYHLHGHADKKSRSGSGSHKMPEQMNHGPDLFLNADFHDKGSYRMILQARTGDHLLVAQFMLEVFEKVKQGDVIFPKPTFVKKNGMVVTGIPIRHSMTMNPNQKHEISFLVLPGQKLKISFISSRKLDYDLHYHPGGNKSDTQYLMKKIKKSFHQHEYPIERKDKTWLMWVNENDEKVQLQYEIHIDTVR